MHRVDGLCISRLAVWQGSGLLCDPSLGLLPLRCLRRNRHQVVAVSVFGAEEVRDPSARSHCSFLLAFLRSQAALLSWSFQLPWKCFHAPHSPVGLMGGPFGVPFCRETNIGSTS